MRTVIPLSIPLLLLLLNNSSANAQNCGPIVQQHRDATVRLSVTATVTATGAIRQVFGSGVIVSQEGFVLTNNHVVDAGADARDVRITGSIGSSAAAAAQLELIAQNAFSDLALLRFANTSLSYSAAPIGNPWLLVDGSPLCSGGFPLDLEFFVSSGVLGNKGGPKGWWLTNLAASPGESGAPVFDATGGLIAIKVGGRSDAENINLVVPINLARPLLQITSLPDQSLTNLKASSAPTQLPGNPPTQTVACRVDRTRESTNGLTPSSDVYVETCPALAGYKIIKAGLVRASENNLSDASVTIAPDGSRAELRYRLTSGPAYDRWRGWIDGSIVTEQTVIQ